MRSLVVLLVFGLASAACASDPDGGDTVSVTTTVPITVPPAPLPGPTLESGDHEFTILSSGGARLYLVHVPADLPEHPVPVVMSLHGGGGSAPQHKNEIGLDAIADTEGFIAVYPEGNGATRLHTWNAGPYCCGAAARDNIDDVAFLADVLADLAEHVTTDPDRVAVAGHSNGAMMASRFAAERPDLVGAVIAVAAVAAPDQVPAEPVPMLQIHSVDDPRALYEGGEGPVFPGTNSTVVHTAAMTSIRAWADANGCRDTFTESEPIVADNGHTATWIEWEDCTERVVHYRLTGSGHGWPGTNSGREATAGPATEVISASEEVWAFANEVFVAAD